MYDRRMFVISLEDMEPTELDSMKKAAKAIGAGEGVIRYVKNNGKVFFKDKNYKVFFIKWC